MRSRALPAGSASLLEAGWLLSSHRNHELAVQFVDTGLSPSMLTCDTLLGRFIHNWEQPRTLDTLVVSDVFP